MNFRGVFLHLYHFNPVLSCKALKQIKTVYQIVIDLYLYSPTQNGEQLKALLFVKKFKFRQIGTCLFH